jgi:hypothetical protein
VLALSSRRYAAASAQHTLHGWCSAGSVHLAVLQSCSALLFLTYGHAVPQGNLLRRGPVVFRIPPEVVRVVREDADGGDAACEQLMLDLYRCSNAKGN